MGPYSASKSHYKVVKGVLRGHLIDVPGSPVAYRSPRVGECPKTFKQIPETPNSLMVGKGSRQRKAVLASVGFTPEISEQELGHVATLFLAEERHGGYRSPSHALASAKMVQRFIDWSVQAVPGQRDEKSILLCEERPLEYAAVLAKVFQANTRRNHCRAMVALFELATVNLRVKQAFGTTPFIHRKLVSLKELWSELKRKDATTARAEQRFKMRSEQFKNAPIKVIMDFLVEITPLVETYVENWNIHDLRSHEEIKAVNCFVSIVMALHGQRLCAAVNLTAEEVLNAREIQGRFVVRVKNHKTAKFHGPAAICLRAAHFAVFKNIAEFHRRRSDGDGKLLNAPKGQACKILFQQVNERIKVDFPDFPGLTFNLIRKTIETNSHLAISYSGDAASKDLNHYLNHGRSVSDLYYRFRTDSHILSEAKVVETVISQLLCMDMARCGQLQLPTRWKSKVARKQSNV